MSEAKPHRLPQSAVPERYEIRLTPDLTNWTFAGDEKVTVQVHDPVREIVLNAAELKVESVSARAAGSQTLSATVTLDSENEQARFRFSETIAPGKPK